MTRTFELQTRVNSHAIATTDLGVLQSDACRVNLLARAPSELLVAKLDTRERDVELTILAIGSLGAKGTLRALPDV